MAFKVIALFHINAWHVQPCAFHYMIEKNIQRRAFVYEPRRTGIETHPLLSKMPPACPPSVLISHRRDLACLVNVNRGAIGR